MEPTLRTDFDVASLDAELLVVPVFGTAQGEIPPAVRELLPTAVVSDARGTAGAQLMAWPASGPRRIGLVGVGKALAEIGLEDLRRFAGRAIRLAETHRIASVSVLLPASDLDADAAHQAIAEGLVLAAWSFRELKTGVGEDEAPARVEAAEILGYGDAEVAAAGVRHGTIVAAAENVARTLQMRPGNVATPSHLAAEAERLGTEAGLSVEVFDRDRIASERMNALLAVSQGSAQDPRFIVLRHAGGAEGEKPLVLVGKGLTFDAGGISLKPPKGMEDMKFDMSGGAGVIAAMIAISRLGIPRNVVGVVPSSENLLGAAAVKPGDVVTTRAGITVEVINTDAEGRLILCDALDWSVHELDPEAMVDCATLTGAVVIGLGHQAMGVLGTDQEVVDGLIAAGERTGERGWQLPLWPEYRQQLESPAADVQNVGGRPAGTITAAAFLREFVKDVPWGHLDIAGTAYGDGGRIPYRRPGGYGVPTRLLVEWVRSRSA